MGCGHFLLIGSATNWLLCSCLPLILPICFAKWRTWRIPAIVLTLFFLWGGAISCVRDAKRSENLKMIRNMYHDRAGFDFEKVFPPLPDKIAVAKDGISGMRFKSLYNSDVPYRHFLNSLPAKGFVSLAKESIVLRYNGKTELQKHIIYGEGFYKDLGKGFGAVVEYTGDFCALYIIRGMGE